MQLDLDDEETLALLNLLVEAIEADRYPLSRRVHPLRAILAKFGELGPALPPARRYLLQIASKGEWKTVAYVNDIDEAWHRTAEASDTRVFDTWRQEPLKPPSPSPPARLSTPEERDPQRRPRRAGRSQR